MGKPMCKNLLKAGHELVIYSRAIQMNLSIGFLLIKYLRVGWGFADDAGMNNRLFILDA